MFQEIICNPCSISPVIQNLCLIFECVSFFSFVSGIIVLIFFCGGMPAFLVLFHTFAILLEYLYEFSWGGWLPVTVIFGFT